MKLNEHHFFTRDMEIDFPVAIRGKGSWIWDEEGRKYLDGCAGANVTGIGHGIAEIGEAMAKQTKEIAYVPPRHFLNRPSIELARRLIELAPEGFNRVLLLSGGSEAMESAFRISRQYHVLKGDESKYKIISRWQGFHGNTLGTDAVGGHTGRRKIYTPMFISFPHIIPACCYRCAFEKTYPDCRILCARDLKRAILQEGPEYISAFSSETIVGAAAAAVVPVEEYYPMIRKICDEYDMLWIADEIMAGVGRTGTFTAIEQWGVSPDLIVLAKGISSGYAPLAAILISDKVFKVFYDKKAAYVGGHTYNAHAVTSSVGLAVLDYIERNNIFEIVKEKGEILGDKLKLIYEKNPIVGDVRGRGLFWGLELVEDRYLKKPFDPSICVSEKVVQVAMDKGLTIYPVVGCADGERGNGVLICPPLVITDNEIDFLYEKLDETLSEVSNMLGVS